VLHAWRIVKRRHVEEAFNGEGARLYGGRWNSPGVPVVYVAESRALAALEIMAGLRSRATLNAYVLIEVRFEEYLVEELDRDSLPVAWRTSPPRPETQAIGDRWVREARSVVLRVPSVVIPAEFNFLLNPTHPEFDAVEILGPTPFEFDSRLEGSE
jgi:RES domain-containing protein